MDVLSYEGLTKPTCAWGIFSDTFLFNLKKNFPRLWASVTNNTVCQQKAFWVQLCFSFTMQHGKKCFLQFLLNLLLIISRQ